jgi:hypothetical protein
MYFFDYLKTWISLMKDIFGKIRENWENWEKLGKIKKKLGEIWKN